MTIPLPACIRDRARFALFSVSAACYLSWLLPLDSGSNAHGVQLRLTPLQVAADTSERTLPLVVIRDPFAAAPDIRASATGATDGEATAPAPADPDVPLDNRAHALLASERDAPTQVADGDVPNIGNDAHAAMEPVHSYIVRATIVGRSAVAYVQDGPDLEIVRVGDHLGNARIVGIDLRGLRFANGARLDLATGFRTPAAPPANDSGPMTRAELVHVLRSILGKHATTTPARAATAEGAQRQPASIGVPPYPTPGPLPTVDQRGSSAATRATDVPSAPTPYPVPGIDR